MKRLFVVLLFLPLLGWCAPAGDPLAGLSPDEFRSAGLHKLSADELETLRSLLLRAQPKLPAAAEEGPVASLPQGEAAFGQEQKLLERVEHIQRVPRKITSRILGDFRGWRGKTLFELENGQTWQQISPGQFVVGLTDPVVHVEKGAFGVFYFRVEGFGSQVKVKRVK